MMQDLTHNFTKTESNLTPTESVKVLQMLKQTHMPVHYIRNKKLQTTYKEMLKGTKTTSTGFQRLSTPRFETPTAGRIYKRRRRDYLS
jgi:hypothetical protein